MATTKVSPEMVRRIFYDYGDMAFDLGNIKYIDTRRSSYPGFPDDWYVRIHLLRGNEYVFNPETGETKLVNPVIETGRMSGRESDSVIKDITEKWEAYLESKERD